MKKYKVVITDREYENIENGPVSTLLKQDQISLNL